MTFTVKTASTSEELEKVLALRYNILRKPWNQPASPATDGLDEQSINAFIEDEEGNAIACGRLQENENKAGQIRFMAVDDKYQGKGLGKLIVTYLEKEGEKLGLKAIELQ